MQYLKLDSDTDTRVSKTIPNFYIETGTYTYDSSLTLDPDNGGELTGGDQFHYYCNECGLHMPNHFVNLLILNDAQLNANQFSSVALMQLLTACAEQSDRFTHRRDQLLQLPSEQTNAT